MAEPVVRGPVTTGPPATRRPVSSGTGHRPGRHGELLRFVLVGGTNTLVTLGLFVLLQRWLPASVAYTAVFALGLTYTTVMTARVVFGTGLTWRAGSAFVGWYLLVYALGLAVVHRLETLWPTVPLATAAVTIAVTAPLTFLGGRVLFSSGSGGARGRGRSCAASN